MKKADKAQIPMDIYFAYGSNLNLRQMQYRCPTARLLGVGLKRGYALRFRGRGPGYAYLTVTATTGALTPVAAFAVAPSDVAALNCYEGVAGGHYRIEPVSVDITGHGRLRGFWYVMNGGRKFPPSQSYVQTVAEGYQTMGFDMRILQRALNA